MGAAGGKTGQRSDHRLWRGKTGHRGESQLQRQPQNQPRKPFYYGKSKSNFKTGQRGDYRLSSDHRPQPVPTRRSGRSSSGTRARFALLTHSPCVHVPVTCISKAFTFFELKKCHASDRGATMNLKQAGLDFLEGYFSTHDRRKKTRAAYAIT